MKLIKSVFQVGLLTLISRVFGYVRDAVVAFYIGTGILNDAFIVAFRLPNLFRTIFGEGAFNSAFVPIYSKILHKDGKNAATTFASKVQTMLLGLLIILSVLMMIFMEKVIAFTAPGYAQQPEYLEFITRLGRITFPYIVFMSLMAFYGGMLNSHGRYFAFASAPILLNVVLIFAITYKHEGELASFMLAYGALLAGVLELLWVLIFAYKDGIGVGFKSPLHDENIKKLFKALTPGILGSGVSQINVWVSTILASFVPGGISYLYYADRIYQLPLALIGTAMSTVLLPVLSKHFGSTDVSMAVQKQNEALEFSMLLAIPSVFAISYLSYDIIHILFERGEFTQASTLKTADALMVFSFGLPAYILVKIFTSPFFANHDTKTPVKIAATALVINISLSIVLLGMIEHVAIAVGSVISAWVNAASLIYFSIKRGYYHMRNKRILWQILRFFIASVIMLLAICFVKNNWGGYIAEMLELLIYCIIGLVIYLLVLVLAGGYSR